MCAGLLRAACRRREVEGKLPDPLQLAQRGAWQPVATPEAAATAQLLGLQYSHPPWLVQRWLATFGQERTLRLLAAGNRRAPVGRTPRQPAQGWGCTCETSVCLQTASVRRQSQHRQDKRAGRARADGAGRGAGGAVRPAAARVPAPRTPAAPAAERAPLRRPVPGAGRGGRAGGCGAGPPAGRAHPGLLRGPRRQGPDGGSAHAGPGGARTRHAVPRPGGGQAAAAVRRGSSGLSTCMRASCASCRQPPTCSGCPA